MSLGAQTSGASRFAPWQGLIQAAPALLGGVVLMLAMFWEEGRAATQVWADSTAYSHCYFVLPIALYILWDRRDTLRGATPQPMLWAAAGVVPLGLAWLMAERMGFMEGRQLVAMTILQLLFLTVLGWRLWWGMSAGLLYLYFLVPFGAFLTPWLQHFTAQFIPVGLNILGIPNYVDAFLIEIPEGRFFVAEACAGLRFLIAAVAFGVLYSVLIYRSPWRRAAFMLASVIIPIVANGFRALGIVVLGHILGSAQAGAADHIIYGWLFFSVVILLLILAGMPFREDLPSATAPPRIAPGPPVPSSRIALAAALVCVLTVVPTLVSFGLTMRAGTVAPATPPRFVSVAPCNAIPQVAPAPAALAPGVGSVSQYACGAITLKVTVLAFPPRSTNAPIRAAQAGLGLAGDNVETGSLTVPLAMPPVWQLAETTDMLHATASTVWIDGVPARGGLLARLRQVRDSVLGAHYPPVLVMLDADLPRDRVTTFVPHPARDLLRQFVAAQYDLPGQIQRFAREAAGE